MSPRKERKHVCYKKAKALKISVKDLAKPSEQLPIIRLSQQSKQQLNAIAAMMSSDQVLKEREVLLKLLKSYFEDLEKEYQNVHSVKLKSKIGQRLEVGVNKK